MKKILTILTILLSTTPIYAQESVEVVQESNNIGFFSILLGTLTVALLVSIAYMLVKMSNK